MHKLTPDQYDVFYLAAINLIYAIYEGRGIDPYADQLMICTTILTGQYPKRDVMQNIIDKAKASDRSRKGADALIKLLIGGFSYDESQLGRESTISQAEIDALGGIY